MADSVICDSIKGVHCVVDLVHTHLYNHTYTHTHIFVVLENGWILIIMGMAQSQHDQQSVTDVDMNTGTVHVITSNMLITNADIIIN